MGEHDLGKSPASAKSRAPSTRIRRILYVVLWTIAGLAALVPIGLLVAKIAPDLVRGRSLLDVASILLFVAASVLVLRTRPFARRSADQRARIRVGSWLDIEAETKLLYVILALLSIALAGWLQIAEQQHMTQRSNAQLAEKPAQLSVDEWYLQLGMNAYRFRNYERALGFFSKIVKLSESRLVEWKLYEALAKMRLMEHARFIRLESIDPTSLDEVIRSLDYIYQSHPDDRLHPTAAYWYAQALYQFRDGSTPAERIFRTSAQDPWGQWTQGAMYYLARILQDRGGIEDLTQAELILQNLLQKYPDGLIRIVERGEDVRVRAVVPGRLVAIRAKLRALADNGTR